MVKVLGFWPTFRLVLPICGAVNISHLINIYIVTEEQELPGGNRILEPQFELL